uniref:PAS domain S-box protein n=1 Tax=Sphingomonas sp. CFBP 8764 TaxID=2775275 RepID=UPI00313B6450
MRAPRISFTYRLRLPNGTQRFLEGSARCFYDQAGAMVRTTGITLDITRHEEREAALRVREAQLRSILETVPDAMIVIDEAGAIRSFSAAAELIFGYSAAEAIGLNVQTLIPGEREAWQQGYLRRYPASGDRRGVGHGRLTTARRADGSSFPVELHVGEALVDGERVLTGFVRDISERIAAEERLSLVRRELMQVIRLNAVGEMAAALAHELNQPLAAIANFVTTAELLLDSGAGMDGDRLKATLISANTQALRAGDIIHRLREFIAKRESEMRIEPVEATLREAVTLLTSGGQHADIELSFALSPDADFMLADRIQVQQVVVNLLRNAFEALATSPDGARRPHRGAVEQSGARRDQHLRQWSRLARCDPVADVHALHVIEGGGGHGLRPVDLPPHRRSAWRGAGRLQCPGRWRLLSLHRAACLFGISRERMSGCVPSMSSTMTTPSVHRCRGCCRPVRTC